LAGKRILHFAPEWPLYCRLKDEAGYVGGDIIHRRNADAVVDTAAIDSDDTSYDVLICNYALEHVPDHLKAILEYHRVLREDGIAFFSVPLDASRAQTWYPPDGMLKKEVEEICRWDHKRLYGRDLTSLLESSGFAVVAVELYDDWVDKIPALQRVDLRAHASTRPLRFEGGRNGTDGSAEIAV
jgi:SAM-dependent methyltransferase